MKMRLWTVVLATSVALISVFAPRCSAAPDQTLEKNQLAIVEQKTSQLVKAVENLQEDIVEELSGVKEKQLYHTVDLVLHELTKMEKMLGKGAVTREDLYKQFDSVDSQVAILRKVLPELAPKQPVLLRGAERIRFLTVDLHFVVSQGDTSPERFRQVLVRQATALGDVTNKLSATAQYALGVDPGRGELLVAMQKLAEASRNFEKVAGTTADLEKCRKEFSALNEAWQQVVRGVSLLPPKENGYLLRGANQADAIHERLFRLLQIKGDRSALTIRT